MDGYVPNFSVSVPEEYIGDVCAQLTDRGGLIVAMDDAGGVYDIRALVSDAAMNGFESWLRTATFGRGLLKRLDGSSNQGV